MNAAFLILASCPCAICFPPAQQTCDGFTDGGMPSASLSTMLFFTELNFHACFHRNPLAAERKIHTWLETLGFWKCSPRFLLRWHIVRPSVFVLPSESGSQLLTSLNFWLFYLTKHCMVLRFLVPKRCHPAIPNAHRNIPNYPAKCPSIVQIMSLEAIPVSLFRFETVKCLFKVCIETFFPGDIDTGSRLF